MKKLAIFILILAVAGTVGVWVAYNRPKGQPREARPTVGATPSLPEGAIYSTGPLPIDEWRLVQHETLARKLGRSPKEILVVSGGGARGAFGAGVLTGWSQSGKRPDFDVVTGVSVGSLQAVFAFLGSAFDGELEELFAHHQHLSDFSLWESPRGAVSDVTPFEQAIREKFDQQVMEAVAQRYSEGKFLFVGTTNLDAGEFVVWDMGAIASSGRPDALHHFQSVLLASCSMPMVFPPSFFEVEVDGATYREMHVDGGVRSPLFLPDFVVDSAEDDSHVYIVVNHTIESTRDYHPIGVSPTDIGFASFRTLLDDKLSFSLRSCILLTQNAKLECKVVGLLPDWGDSSFSVRPEYVVKDPKMLFEKARAYMETDPWIVHKVEEP